MTTMYVINIRIHFELFLLLATNNRREIYCDWRGKIFKVINKSWHKFLLQQPVIIVIIVFRILKAFTLYGKFSPPPQKKNDLIVHKRAIIGTVNHLQCFLWLKRLNWSHCVICAYFVWYIVQDSVLSTYIPRNFVLYVLEIHLFPLLTSKSNWGLS